MESWRDFFEARAEPLRRGELDDVAAEVRAAVASGGEEAAAALKRFARRLHREPPAGLDPWRVAATFRRCDPDRTLRLRGSPLMRSPIPALGVREPELHLRTWAMARAVLRAFERDAPRSCADVPALSGVPGGDVVFWWLTGAPEPESAQPHHRDNALFFADAAGRALERFGLLGEPSLAQRRARIEAWRTEAAADRKSDLLRDEFEAGLSGATESIAEALDGCAAAVRGDVAAALDETCALLGALWKAPLSGTDPATLARWCSQATAVGIVGASEVSDDSLDRYRERVADRLVADLATLLPAQPLSLSTSPVDRVFWQSASVLLRDRSDAGDVAHVQGLLDAIAETGAWTGSCARPIARCIDIVLESEGVEPDRAEHVARGFASRFAWTSARRREHGAASLWKRALGRYVKIAGAGPVVDELQRWLSPKAALPENLDDAEAEALTARLAGPELPAGADRNAMVRWWAEPDQRRFLERSEGSPLHRVAERLQQAPAIAAPAAGATPARSGSSLHVEMLEGRHGELYLLPKLFGVRGRDVSLLVADDRYETPHDQRPKMDALDEQLERLRGKAELGRVSRVEVRRVQAAVGGLAAPAFWAGVGDRAPDGPIEIVTRELVVPWELAPVPIERDGELTSVPLSLATPTFRRRALDAPAGAIRSMLVLYDPSYDGAEEELEVLEELWLDGEDRSFCAVDTVEGFRRATEDRAFDVVHYAGHQGPGSDATPSLALRGARLPLIDLVDAVHDRPPRLLFLNACSTLSPTRRLEAENGRGFVVFGLLEPLLKSTIPQIAGTLWDLTPPTDGLFVRSFYGALLAGRSAIAAMHEARLSASKSARWAPWWPAYVLLAPADA